MVTYGPWEQGDDFAVTSSTVQFADHWWARTQFDRTGYTGGGDNAEYISQALTAERYRAAAAEYQLSSGAGVNLGARVSTDARGGLGSLAFETWVARDDVGFFTSASNVASITNYAASIPRPPEAVQVELERYTFTPLSMSGTVTWVSNGNPGAPLNVTISTRPAAAGRGDRSGIPTEQHRILLDHAAPTPVSFSFDLQPGQFDPSTGGFILLPTSECRDSPNWWTAGTTAEQELLGLARNFNASSQYPPIFRWLLRPPRHRFVYAGSPGLPPLRQSPRDDRLGAASAARVWPTSSQQGSLRRHGYF